MAILNIILELITLMLKLNRHSHFMPTINRSQGGNLDPLSFWALPSCAPIKGLIYRPQFSYPMHWSWISFLKLNIELFLLLCVQQKCLCTVKVQLFNNLHLKLLYSQVFHISLSWYMLDCTCFMFHLYSPKVWEMFSETQPASQLILTGGPNFVVSGP